MITEKEQNAVKLSPTKRDFYQIWNELLDTAENLSAIYNPKSTNESDPGIVLLKVLTAIADKLNYTIDKNILEAFMPSATQAESMRKLCDMMGYNMKYYNSATTDVKIAYKGEKSELAQLGASINIAEYTCITDKDNTVNYFVIPSQAYDTPTIISATVPSVILKCMEGSCQLCQAADGTNLITLADLDDNFRYYLPETAIAENGMFIKNATIINNLLQETSELWEIKQNLNTVPLGTKCFKFCFFIIFCSSEIF